MKPIAFIIMASAWACLFLAPSGQVSRFIQFVVYSALGSMLVLIGFLSNYWDSNMRPSQQSSFVLVCGVATVASQLGTLLRMLSGAADEEFPGGAPRANRNWRKRR